MKYVVEFRIFAFVREVARKKSIRWAVCLVEPRFIHGFCCCGNPPEELISFKVFLEVSKRISVFDHSVMITLRTSALTEFHQTSYFLIIRFRYSLPIHRPGRIFVLLFLSLPCEYAPKELSVGVNLRNELVCGRFEYSLNLIDKADLIFS